MLTSPNPDVPGALLVATTQNDIRAGKGTHNVRATPFVQRKTRSPQQEDLGDRGSSGSHEFGSGGLSGRDGTIRGQPVCGEVWIQGLTKMMATIRLLWEISLRLRKELVAIAGVYDALRWRHANQKRQLSKAKRMPRKSGRPGGQAIRGQSGSSRTAAGLGSTDTYVTGGHPSKT
jgi:hypothetical protein